LATTAIASLGRPRGIGVGGEWGGSVLLAMAWASTSKNRGYLASWPQFSAGRAVPREDRRVVFQLASGDQFFVWGRRAPCFPSIVMVAIGLWIRLGIQETPVFQRVVEQEGVERVPVLEVLRRQPKEILLTALLRLPEQAPGYIVVLSSLPMARPRLGCRAISC
jgi:hypothetical protein